MTAAVGVIVNPRAGKDVRGLSALASAPTDAARLAMVRRIVTGALEGGAELVIAAADAQGLVERAVSELDGPIELLAVGGLGTGDDSTRAATLLRDRGVGAVVVAGGDGTHRDVAKGWRDVPMVALAAGTNNSFPQEIEATIAGGAAGLAVSIDQPLDDFIAYRCLVIDYEREGSPVDLGLVNAAVVQPDKSSVSSLDGVDQIFASVAEPWSVGLSAMAGVIAPSSRTDDRGVLLDLDPDAPKRVRAPIAPGRFAEGGLRSVSVVDVEQPVAVRGPVGIILDGERVSSLGADEWGSLTLRRNGPRMIDIRRTYSIAVRGGRFLTERSPALDV